MRSRRFLFVVLVGILLVGALAAGHASNATRPSATTGATVSPAAAVVTHSSTVWFCPGLPPALPHAAGRVTFANVGDTAADVVVTDLADKGNATHVAFSVPVRSVVTKTRDQLGSAGALTIETFGGRAVVEEGVQGPPGFETTPCATESSTHWNFAAGSTLRGVQQWLIIDNPYASDAKVDVTLRTSSGKLQPDALQSLDIARRSREVVAIHDIAVRQDRVAVEVDTEVGSVVAAQALVYSADAGSPGIALSIGAPATATEWTFADGISQAGSNAVVAIANVGNDDAQVDVQATAEGASKRTLAPASIAVAQDAVVWVSLGTCTAANTRACISIPNGARYSLDVHSEQNVSIVAQTLTRFTARRAARSRPLLGTVTSLGAIAPARSWTFAVSRVPGEVTTTLSLLNPSARAVVAAVGLVSGGAVQRPHALQGITLPPGRVVTVDVVGDGAPKNISPNDAALTIDANQPVYVSRLIATSAEASSAVGVVVGG